MTLLRWSSFCLCLFGGTVLARVAWAGGLGEEKKTDNIPANQQSGWGYRSTPAPFVTKKKSSAKAVPKKEWILDGVLFEKNADKLTLASHSALNEAVATLKENETLKVEIQGHTDSRGDTKHNELLSLRRAESVKTYLIQKGISAQRLKTRGVGASKPMVSNETEEGRQKNRRIEFKILSR